MKENICFGIDLGTTNSCISMMRSNTTIPDIIPLKYGNTLQSCVMLNDDGTLTVGKEAYEYRYTKSAIYSVKRYMGTDTKITLVNGNMTKVMSPEEVSAEILKELVKQAEEYVGHGIIKEVTITVPAHFNDLQRRATKKAGEIAGLKVLNIINEPTSAGLLYGVDNNAGNQTVLVYDLGGGTFDISILRVTKQLRGFPFLDINMNGEYNDISINIVGNEGDVHLGGDDIDKAMTEYIINKISEQSHISVETIKSILGVDGVEELKLKYEKAKKAFSHTIFCRIPDVGDYTIVIDSDEAIDSCYRPVFNRTYELVAKAMSQSRVSMIDHIVLVGGSTKSEIIQMLLREKFPHIHIMNSFEPDLSVGLGASISSATTTGLSNVAKVTDVVPMSIGIVCDSDSGLVYSKILKKDSSLPCVEVREFEITDQNRSVVIDIRQGDSSRDIDKLVCIGNLEVTPDKFKSKYFNIKFKCDLNGRLECCLMVSGEEISIPIQYSVNNDIETDNGFSDIDLLDKGQRFFYESHLRKLKKAGASKDILDRWIPSVVFGGIDGAREVFNTLLSEVVC